MLQELIEELQLAKNAIKEKEQLEVEVKALEETVGTLKDENNVLEQKLDSAYSAIRELEENPPSEKSFLGLDTLNWELENGNLIIQQRVEEFIEKLQQEFSVSAGMF